MRSWVLEGWLRGHVTGSEFGWQSWSHFALLMYQFCGLWSGEGELGGGLDVMSESLWGHHAGEADEQQHSSGSSQSSVSSLNTSPWWSLNLMINNPQWTMNTVQLMCYNNNEHEMKVCDGCRVDDGGHADRKLFKTCYNLIVCRSSPVHRSCC